MTDTERDRLIVVEQKLDAILDKMDAFAKGQQDHECRIRQLELKPARHWEAIVAALISTGVGAAIGFFLASMGQ